MSRINTISEFLLQAGTDYRIFDMGRAIRPLSSQAFLDFELNQTPAAFPRQQHVWLGIVFFNKGLSQEHYIWFVKLPLDEQGKLMSAARNQFLHIVVEALGQGLEKHDSAQKGLPENPFTFVPNQQQLASFNSISRLALALPPSQYFSAAEAYLHCPQEIQWQKISLQGIADIAARINEEPTKNLVLQQFSRLALQVQIALCDALENHPLNHNICQLIISEWRKQPMHADYLLPMLRALSQCEDTDLVTALLLEILSQDELMNDNVLVLIAARHWQCLENKPLLSLYITRLSNASVDLFGGLFRDLVQVPNSRNLMLDVLRWPKKEPALAHCIKKLFES